MEERDWTESFTVLVNEVATMRLQAAWLVSVEFDLPEASAFAWRNPDGSLDGFVERCWSNLRGQGACQSCLEWALQGCPYLPTTE